MSFSVKMVAGTVTLAGLVGAVAIGGGVPLSPAAIARGTGTAADNVERAVANTRDAVKSTDALRRIANAVDEQVAASHRLLEIQLEIEQSSRAGGRESVALARSVAAIQRSLRRLRARLAALSTASAEAGDNSENAASAAGDLSAALSELEDRFDVVVKQSRRLDRKARGYRELRDGP